MYSPKIKEDSRACDKCAGALLIRIITNICIGPNGTSIWIFIHKLLSTMVSWLLSLVVLGISRQAMSCGKRIKASPKSSRRFSTKGEST